jgi:hypothetical protein
VILAENDFTVFTDSLGIIYLELSNGDTLTIVDIHSPPSFCEGITSLRVLLKNVLKVEFVNFEFDAAP